MYGDESDPLVRYYDRSLGIGSAAEAEWYLAKVREFGGPVLDVACGTGRLAVRLLEAGFEVACIDRSAGMLAQLRRKLAALPPDARRRADVRTLSMSDFALGRRFRSVLCCDAFFHNLTVAEQVGCLTRVAEHLAPEGRFLFNLPNPTDDFIAAAAASAGERFEERGRFDLGDGGTLVIEHAHDADVSEQTITTTLRFARYDADGTRVGAGESRWKSRYLFRADAERLLDRCGFDVESLVGDYGNGPVTGRGQLVFQARLRRA